MRSRRSLWLALAAVVAARLFAFWLFPLLAEDALISMHAGIDPAWHAATTSPLWSIVCGGSPALARLWSLVADCAAVWAAWRLLSGWGLAAFVALWCSPFFTGSGVSGLETHVAAAAMLMARVTPVGYTLAAALRPDTAVLSLVAAGRRWRWAAAGALAFLALSVCYGGHWIPQTVTSKALSYGVHPGAWGWLHPPGFGWMTLALVPALWSRGGRWHIAAALSFLLAEVVLGSVGGWWYAVPPLAVLGLAACESIRRPRHLVPVAACLLFFGGEQCDALHSRVVQERELWSTGLRLRDYHPTGTVLLEPAGMIPFLSPNLTAKDDVGLVDPWMARRRAAGPGWRTDAIARYRPDWIVVRMREYAFPESLSIGKPYYGKTDGTLPGYSPVYASSAERIDRARVRINLRSSSLVILRRKVEP